MQQHHDNSIIGIIYAFCLNILIWCASIIETVWFDDIVKVFGLFALLSSIASSFGLLDGIKHKLKEFLKIK
ncbi:MAG: hypothetical protein JNL32_04770 [Candidatus Kapabacteria bacterium]|nr:hypothetical protein [Candidatus Kapabacteria bacterium]